MAVPCAVSGIQSACPKETHETENPSSCEHAPALVRRVASARCHPRPVWVGLGWVPLSGPAGLPRYNWIPKAAGSVVHVGGSS